ncbi:class I adenylate-forming enzyme family protein [Mycobacterium sp. M26]|uniref:class I adenylate-forming enzyme family protein n=1 Tax=Mycobacterium sp. M26 TaxID=1762962 RepID=UPI00073E9ADB|nr:class I adenylate-forming enzyme family protein [Mycobacterium sp. M26]
MISRPVDGYAGYLTRAAARWPARVALRFEGATWTYADLDSTASVAARRLAAAGITTGTRVLLLVENCPEYLIAQFALARLGAVFVTPNPYWTDTEVSHAIGASGATAAIHTPRFDSAVSGLDVTIPVDTLVDDMPPASTEHAAQQDDQPSYIPFSSGTTGMPKGVVHTVGSLCGAVEQLRHHLALTDRDRLQISLPLCHIFGTTMSGAAISVGAEMTLFRRFDLDRALAHIRQAGVTIWPLAGAVAHQLAERTDLRPEDFTSLCFFMWGGSAVPTALADQITVRTGVRFLCSYGMTEAMTVAFNPVDEPAQWRLDSPGYPTLGTQLRLADNGELEVRGPSVASGYASGESSAFGADGWFRTGDVAAIDDDGRVRIIDRAKDMLKVSGFQVAPVEVEQALMEHPGVIDAAVVGRSDERAGEIPVAFVVSSDPALTSTTLDGWLAGRLATYKRPREYRFVESLPRTPGGKIRRAELRPPG